MTDRIMKKILPAIFLVISIASAQTPLRQKLRTGLDSLEARYRSASTASARLSRQADSLAAVIQQRKGGKSRSILSDRALADELRRSQELANDLQAARQIEATKLDSLLQKAEQMLKILNDEITRLTVQFSAAKSDGDSAQQKKLAAELREAEQLRQRCQALLQNVPAPAPLLEVRLNPDDSPEALAQKADFLLDQSDRLRRNATRAEAKSKHLRQEINMRERLADFVQDLRVFDPGSETPKSVGEAKNPRGEVVPISSDVNAGRESFLAGSSQIVLANEQLWPQDIAQLSDAELKKWISRLESQRRHWAAQADSLANQAKAFSALGIRKSEQR